MCASRFILFVSVLFFSARTIASAQVQWALDTVIETGAYSSGIAITSDGSKLVVTNNTNPGTVKVISTSNYAVSNIDISSIENYPNGVTITPNDSTALVNTTHKTVFIDLKNNSIAGNSTAPCASTTLYGIAVTPNSQYAIIPDLSSGCTQQGLRSIDATGRTSGSSFIQVTTSGELYGIAITPDGTSAIVTTYSLDSPKKVNLITSGVQNITGMSGSYGVAILHSGNEALIFDGDSLDRVSLISNSVTKKISYLTYNTNFQNIAITTDDKYAFVIGSFEKLIISLANDSVIQTFSAGGTNVATTSDGSRFFVTDSYNGTVRVYKNVTPSRVENDNTVLPSDYELHQNYPNPFNPSTTIRYQLSVISNVSLKVFDMLGRDVATLVNERKPSGSYQAEWNAAGMPSGVYFYRFSVVPSTRRDLVPTEGRNGQASTFTETKKLILLR